MLQRLSVWTQLAGGALVLFLVLLALGGIVSPSALLDAPGVGLSMQAAGWALGLIAATLSLLASLAGARFGRSVGRARIDRAFRWTSLSWLLFAASATWVGLDPTSDAAGLSHLVGYQLCVLAGVGFLLECCSFDTWRERLLWLLLAVLSLGLVGLSFVGPVGPGLAYLGWRVLNVLGLSALFFLLGRRLLRAEELRAWLVFGACLVGLGIGLGDMVAAASPRIATGPTHWVFAAYLLLLWLLFTERLGRWLSLAHGDGPPSAAEHTLVVRERHRIAQDLHDGVGSQIVSLLSSLDRSVPQQEAMASALEQCLLDVKIMVDDIDDADEGVLDALGRLRYRVQHSLDRLNIRMVWDVDTDGPLLRFKDPRSREVLHIAQEALANVMRHSQAHTVTLRCHHLKSANALLLDIVDDGVGFCPLDPAQQRGKGLQGMRRRAERLHAELSIVGVPGEGTRVQLALPLGPEKD